MRSPSSFATHCGPIDRSAAAERAVRRRTAVDFRRTAVDFDRSAVDSHRSAVDIDRSAVDFHAALRSILTALRSIFTPHCGRFPQFSTALRSANTAQGYRSAVEFRRTATSPSNRAPPSYWETPS